MVCGLAYEAVDVPEGAFSEASVNYIFTRMHYRGMREQKELVLASGIRKSHLSLLLGRKRSVNLGVLRKLARALATPPATIIDPPSDLNSIMAPAGTPPKMKFRLYYITERAEKVLQQHPGFKGKVAAGTPMPIPDEWPDDFYAKPEYMEFSE